MYALFFVGSDWVTDMHHIGQVDTCFTRHKTEYVLVVEGVGVACSVGEQA